MAPIGSGARRSRLPGSCRLLAAAVAMLLTACSTSGRTAGERASGPSLLPSGASRALGGGTLYLLVGDPVSANLWQVDLDANRIQPLTHNPAGYGVSNFTASAAGIVLGDARSGLDVPEIMVAGRPRQIGDGDGDPPVISPAGEISMELPSDGSKSGPWSVNRLVLAPGPDGPFLTLYRSRRLDPIPGAFGPGGQLAVLLSPQAGLSRLLIFDRHGRLRRKYQPHLRGYLNLVWGPAAYGIAVSNDGIGEGEVVSADGRTIARLPSGWFPQCWSPSGKVLLMSEGSVVENGSRASEIGLWRPGDPDRVQRLGAIPAGPLVQCSWLARPAPGG